MSVSFTYDGAGNLDATFPSTSGHDYQLFSFDPNSTWDYQTASGSTLTLHTTGVSSVSGRHFICGVEDYTARKILAVAILVVDSAGEFSQVSPATFTYDGNNHASVTFTVPGGHGGETWVLEASDYSQSGLGFQSFTTSSAGSSQTVNLTLTTVPASGEDVLFFLWKTNAREWVVATGTVGSTTVANGAYTWNAGGVDFTISATPTSVTHTTPGSLTVEIDVGEVTSPETVNLTVDDSGLPAGVTSSLDISTGTSPYSATLTLTAAAGAVCDSGSVIVTGDDGTNTHSVTIPVTLTGTAGTYDQAGPTDAAQAGSDMDPGGGIAEGAMCVYNGELYWAWTGGAGAGTPYVAKWNGSDWDLIADGAVFGNKIVGTDYASCLHVRLATDGTNLYFAFSRQESVRITDCRGFVDPHDGGGIAYDPYRLEVWQFDGSSWTLLGYVTSDVPLTVNYAGREWASTLVELTAGPEEPGACYAAWFEEGYEGPENLVWYSRHLKVSGFGTSTLGSVSFDGLLTQFPRDTDPIAVPGGAHCVAPSASAQGFPMRLVGTGNSLTLYSQAYDYLPLVSGGPYWSKIAVWTRTGGVTEIDLATDFSYADAAGTFTGYSPPLAVSDAVATRRWVSAGLITSFSSDYMVTRETTVAAPTTFGATFGLSDHHADLIINRFDKLVAEPGNLWQVPTSGIGAVWLLTNRCGDVEWRNELDAQFSAGITYGTGAEEPGEPVIFDDYIWMSGGPGHGGVKAFALPICRDCGECCALVGGLRSWERF